MRFTRYVRALLSVPSMRWRIGSAAVAALSAVALCAALLVVGQGSSPALSSTLTADVAAIPMDDSCGMSPTPTDTSTDMGASAQAGTSGPTDTPAGTSTPTPCPTGTAPASPADTPPGSGSPSATDTGPESPADTPTGTVAPSDTSTPSATASPSGTQAASPSPTGPAGPTDTPADTSTPSPATEPPTTQAPPTEPPSTQPPTTEPPTTEPPTTEPPSTQPPTTTPPTTQPPSTQPPTTTPPTTQPTTTPPTTAPPSTGPPTSGMSTLTPTGPSTVPVLHAITLSGTLAFGDGSTVPQGTQLTVSRAGPPGTSQLPVVTTAAGGAFAFTDTPQVAGAYTYTVSYAGSATSSSASAHYYVTVTRLATTLRLAASGAIVDYQARITLTATLGAASSGHRVSFYAKPAGSKASTLIATAITNAKGVATAPHTMSTTITFSASFAADGQYASATASTSTVSVRVNLAQALAGYYASETYQGSTYRVYHHTATLKDTVTVTPNKHGECTSIQIQILFQGAWQWDVITGCGYLTSASQVFGDFALGKAAGQRYRIRAVFSPAKTDISNLANLSSWQYFRVAT
jgi:hypothetical protein